LNPNEFLPLAIVASSLIPGILIFFLKEKHHASRTFLNLSGAIAKVALVLLVYYGVQRGESYVFRYEIGVDLEFLLRVDKLALLFAILSSALWLVTTLYAVGYLEGSPNRRRFFGFFSICVTASTGIALAGNVLTFFLFYEFLTLATYPLVVHRGTEKALQAGRTYLWYTIGGGTMLFVGIVGLFVLAGPIEFGQLHILNHLANDHSRQLQILFWVIFAGLAVKAAIVPLHGWLPIAMVAPAPVSALLHAVAVVKAGAFGIIRMVYDVFGINLCQNLHILTPLAILAATTILYGSLRALAQNDLKKRLAYSTISQLSYITLGLAIPGILSSTGALAHLVHQGLMKITLFFCAGIISETLGIHKISDLRGIGRRLPLTTGAFTIAALGMIGLPPIAGFISKWYLGTGALAANNPWALLVLLTSSALNAAYFLPILFTTWFQKPEKNWTTTRHSRTFETPWTLLFPALITALLSLLAGLLAMTQWSPLFMAREIADSWYPNP